jgi:hypothetical protein
MADIRRYEILSRIDDIASQAATEPLSVPRIRQTFALIVMTLREIVEVISPDDEDHTLPHECHSRHGRLGHLTQQNHVGYVNHMRDAHSISTSVNCAGKDCIGLQWRG